MSESDSGPKQVSDPEYHSQNHTAVHPQVWAAVWFSLW